MESSTQLSLPLFEPLSFDKLLERRNLSHDLAVTVNRRLKRGWRVIFPHLNSTRTLIIPPYLIDAPEEVKTALIDWALLPCPRRRTKVREIRQRRSLLEQEIWRYVESLPCAHRRTARFDPQTLHGKTAGHTFDLREIFDSVNDRYFNGSLQAVLRWGSEGSKTSFHTKKTDLAGTHVDVITIAGVYNFPEVPRFAIEAVMHHEMLHIAIPPVKRNGRNVIHGREFAAAERRFSQFHEWQQWERECLTKIIRRMKSRHKRGR
jgi:hypothetical protein